MAPPPVPDAAPDAHAAGRVVVLGPDELAGRVARAVGDAGRDPVVATGTGDELKRRLQGAAGLVVLGAATPGATAALDGTGRSIDVDAVRDALDAASSAGVGHVVVLSTAMVYGAW